MATRGALRPRERAIFASLADTYCRPEPVFPPVRETSAVGFVDDLVARSSRLNRIGFRLILRVVELAPLVRGYRATFTKLAAEPRANFILGLEGSRLTILKILARLLRLVAMMSYYGVDRVLRRAGFDPDAIVARGRALREQEGRP
jgi:hypothetical protein